MCESACCTSKDADSALLRYPGYAVQILEVPQKLVEGPEEQSVFILVGPAGVTGDQEPEILVVPNTGATKALVAGLTNYFPYTWDRDHNQLVGYRVTPGGAALQPLWTAAFPLPYDSILAVTAPTPQHVYSYAKVCFSPARWQMHT
jgi:hypothetical protein